MANSKQIVYLSQSQYAELIANGTITVDGVTVTYDENDIYVTPQAEPVTDVRINGTSVSSNGIANIPTAGVQSLGVVKTAANTAGGINIQTGNNAGQIEVAPAISTNIKAGIHERRPIVPSNQHEAVFYGLAKVAGHDEKDSTEPVGTYTPEAKGAIQKMLGVSDLIAPEENNLVASKAYAAGEVFTANGKLYKATAAIAQDAAIIPVVKGEEITGANCEETSVGEGFVKFTDYASTDVAGIVKIGNTNGGFSKHPDGSITLYPAQLTAIKQGYDVYNAIIPSRQHNAVFYGLAKAAGADEKDSTLPVGQYTDTAKTAIRSMIGASSTNVIAIQDTQPTDADTKIWLPETAPEGVEVPTMEDLGDYVKKTDYASSATFGIIRASSGLLSTNGVLTTDKALISESKTGSNQYKPIVPQNQHAAAFYGLAKAAGDTTQSASDNAVGTYTDEAKSAIRGMLGVVGTEDYASDTNAGIIKVISGNGILISQSSKALVINTASDSSIKIGTNAYLPITPSNADKATFYGLAKASGDTTQSSSSNAVGTYTDNAKVSIKAMLGIQDGSTGTVDVSGTTPTITAVENTRYVCGEVTSLNFTPAASGICIVRFTSGSTVTVLTIPSTVKFPEWFDPTSLETNTIYELCVTDGVYGAVMSWAL